MRAYFIEFLRQRVEKNIYGHLCNFRAELATAYYYYYPTRSS